MTLNQLPIFLENIFISGNFSIKNQNSGFVHLKESKYTLHCNGQVFNADFGIENHSIGHALGQGTLVFECVNVIKGQGIVVNIYSCIHKIENFGEVVEVGFTDTDNFNEWQRECTLEIDNAPYFCIAIYPGDNTTHLQIVGDSLSIVAEKQTLENKDILVGTRKKKEKKIQNLQLVKGTLDFKKMKDISEINTFFRVKLREIQQDEQSYLNIWKKYAQIEGEQLLKIVRRCGAIDFMSVEDKDQSMILNCSKQYDNLDELFKKGDRITVSVDKPNYILDSSLEWDVVVEWYSQKPKRGEVLPYREDVEIINIYANNFQIEVKKLKNSTEPIAPNGFISLSIGGDVKKYKERKESYLDMTTNKVANPRLPIIIGESATTQIPNPKNFKYKALDDKTLKKIFKGYSPSQNQREAIEIMLNTPDIALIQGPPGTGKTTVIVALLERLNKELNIGSPKSGQILITAYQHDAVQNIVDRLSINGLMQLKIGAKAGEENDSEARLVSWAKELAHKLKEKYPEIESVYKNSEVVSLLQQYQIRPSVSITKRLLELILSLEGVNYENKKRLKRYLDDFSNFEIDKTKYSGIAYNIRVTEEGFLDDGVDILSSCLDIYKDRLTEEQEKSIKKIIDNKITFADALPILQQLKSDLIYIERQFDYQPEQPRDDIIDLCKKSLDERRIRDGSRELKIAAEFHLQLTSNISGLVSNVHRYLFAFASSIGQSNSKDMKKMEEHKESANFSATIVDEAARSAPLDLFIPLVKTQNQFILVGDHRQLPHMIEDELVRELDRDLRANTTNEEYVNLAESQEKALKESFFERLVKKAKKLEKEDGKRRFITLNTQYRMHPVLGSFVNQNFYEKYGEEFGNGLDESAFTHNLSGSDGKPALWYDVPLSEGKERKDNKSTVRDAEAKRIAEQLSIWLKDPANKTMTFGVISFYKAQIALIKKELQQYGIAENGEILDEYRYYDGQERLRIGSVDAFQGMEFDVVLLSVVRASTNLPTKIPEDKDSINRLKNKIFGHTTIDNRFCVSVSRQKKVLAVFGAKEVATHQFTKEQFPVLFELYKLCESKGKIL